MFAVLAYAISHLYTPYAYDYVTIHSYLVLFDTQQWDAFQVFTPHTNIDGSFLGFSLVLIKRYISIGSDYTEYFLKNALLKWSALV